ncbi:hypothetical protein BDR04DRAFT_1160880 [Suillus decipiens]|nr:hypothetical protein BDR04DRAFT_1160880 [Suillus decipiens]
MTTSDDLLLDPAFWNPEQVSLLRAQLLMPLVSVEIVKAPLVLATIPDPKSLTEPESEPEAPQNNPQLTPLASLEAVPVLATIPDPESVTEPESELEAPLVLATIPDPESVTEPESEPKAPQSNPQLTPLASLEAPLVLATIPDPKSVTEPESESEVYTDPPPVVMTPKPKKNWTDFFATLSPPSPTSNYWKYVTPEEDALWYDHAGTDDGF